MVLIINIFMLEVQAYIHNGIVDCLIIQNIKYKDFYYLILDFGCKNTILMVLDLMVLVQFCINIMVLILGLQV